MQMEVKFIIRRIWIHLLVISSICTSCSISARTKKSCQVLLAFIWFLSAAVELFHNETNTAFNHVIDCALWLEISVCLTMVGYLEMKVLLFSASFFHLSYNLTTDQIRRISSVTIRSFTSTFSFDHKAGGVIIRDILRALHMSSLDFANLWTNCSSIVISIILFGRYLFCWLTIPLNGFHSNVVDHDGWGSSSPIVIDMNSVFGFPTNHQSIWRNLALNAVVRWTCWTMHARVSICQCHVRLYQLLTFASCSTRQGPPIGLSLSLDVASVLSRSNMLRHIDLSNQ